MSSWVSTTNLGMPDQTELNSSIICRACGRSDCVSITTPPPRLIRPELASQTRFVSFSTAKQWSLTCCIFIELASYHGSGLRSRRGRHRPPRNTGGAEANVGDQHDRQVAWQPAAIDG